MTLEFKTKQSEEYYRKLLLLDKVKPFLLYEQKFYIFEEKYCWDILFKDSEASKLAYNYVYLLRKRVPEVEILILKDSFTSYRYARFIIDGRFPEAEKIIAKDPYVAFSYTRDVLKHRFPEAETLLKSYDSLWKRYLEFLISRGYCYIDGNFYSVQIHNKNL